MNKALAVILFAVLLDAVEFGLIFPVLPGLLRELTGVGEITLLYGVVIAAFAAMQFLFAPVLGVLSDRFGRRPILIVSMAGAGLDYVIMVFAPNVEILIIARVIAGLTASSMAIASAYIADITPEEKRAQRFGWLYASFGVGFIIGPALGGMLGGIWIRAPFVAASVFNIINLLLIVFLLPESHPGKATKFTWSELNPFAPLRWALTFKPILPLLAVFVALAFVGHVYMTIWVLFTEDKFGWSIFLIGLSLTVYALFDALSTAFLSGPATARFGERNALLVGLGFEILALVILSLAGHGWIVFALMPIFALGGIGGPALQALLSSKAGDELQGQLQGVLTSLSSLTGVIAPMFFALLYAQVRDSWPGAIWLSAVAIYLMILPLILMGGATWSRSNSK